jgi:hypothetical protein
MFQSPMKKLSWYLIVACVAFVAAFTIRSRSRLSSAAGAGAVSVDAPDSVQLAGLGVQPGVQLVAYVFGGSKCGFCNKPETKKAFASLREELIGHHLRPGAYSSVSVVGVAINTDLDEGLGYLRSIGKGAFDQISTGRGWQNENVVRLIRQQHFAAAGVPLVLIISRRMTATLAPLSMTYSTDSLLRVIQGAQQIAQWVRDGTDLTTPSNAPPSSSPPIGGR